MTKFVVVKRRLRKCEECGCTLSDDYFGMCTDCMVANGLVKRDLSAYMKIDKGYRQGVAAIQSELDALNHAPLAVQRRLSQAHQAAVELNSRQDLRRLVDDVHTMRQIRAEMPRLKQDVQVIAAEARKLAAYIRRL